MCERRICISIIAGEGRVVVCRNEMYSLIRSSWLPVRAYGIR